MGIVSLDKNLQEKLFLDRVYKCKNKENNTILTNLKITVVSFS